MSEARLWRCLRDGLRPLRVDMQRHEDKLAVGIPDVSYGARGVQGWIELKQVARWRRDGTIVVPWRPGQREWLNQRGRMGGRCWLLLRVGREVCLFRHNMLPEIREPIGYDAATRVLSALSWEQGEDVWGELLEVLTQ